MKKIKLLFFTPYAGYTGSEMMLWYLLKSLDQDKFIIKLFSGKKGDLLEKFPAHIGVDYSRAGTTLWGRITDKLLRKLNFTGLEERQLLKLQRQFKPDYWYINTMTMNKVIALAIKYEIRYILHFHELLTQYVSVSKEELKNMTEHAYYTVGCSKKVCENLKILGSQQIHLQYECVDFSGIKVGEDTSRELRAKHRISPVSFLIVMSGQRIERKGFDLFVEAAIRSKNEDYHFLWLGASKNSGYEFFLEKRITEHKLSNITIVAPDQNQYYDYLNAADLFFLTSREDPFPLVMLEAAFLGKPILSFNSGGSNEFISPGIGLVMDEMIPGSIDAGIANMCQKIRNSEFNKALISAAAREYDSANQVRVFENWLLQLA